MTFPAVCPVADKAEWMPPDHTGGPMGSTRGLVLHVNEGNGDPYNYWMDPSTPTASSHFQCMKDGTLIQYVATDVVAWCQVAGSTTWHSVETEGFASEPLTDAQVQKLAKLYAWGNIALGWPMRAANTPLESGFGLHSMGGIAWGGHACPGDSRAAQRQQILTLAANHTPGDEVSVCPEITASDHTHAKALAEWKHLLEVCGFKPEQLDTDAESTATTEAFRTFFKVTGDRKGRIGTNMWRTAMYLATANPPKK